MLSDFLSPDSKCYMAAETGAGVHTEAIADVGDMMYVFTQGALCLNACAIR